MKLLEKLKGLKLPFGKKAAPNGHGHQPGENAKAGASFSDPHSKKLIALGFLSVIGGIVLTATLVGRLFPDLGKPKVSPAEVAESEGAPPAPPEPLPSASDIVEKELLRMDGIVAQLTGDALLQVSLVIECEAKSCGDLLKIKRNQINDLIMEVARGYTLDRLQLQEGKRAFRDQVIEQMSQLKLEVPVVNIYFTDFFLSDGKGSKSGPKD